MIVRHKRDACARLGGSGTSYESKLETLSGYALTAKTAVLIAEKILAGNYKPGYQTPAMVYGEDLILEVDATERTDLS